MSTTVADPLTDPRLRGSYREPRSAVELCQQSHYFHMQMVRQDQWLKEVLKRADERRAADEAQLEKDLAAYRKTGKMPDKKTSGKRAVGTPKKRGNSNG